MAVLHRRFPAAARHLALLIALSAAAPAHAAVQHTSLPRGVRDAVAVPGGVVYARTLAKGKGTDVALQRADGGAPTALAHLDGPALEDVALDADDGGWVLAVEDERQLTEEPTGETITIVERERVLAGAFGPGPPATLLDCVPARKQQQGFRLRLLVSVSGDRVAAAQAKCPDATGVLLLPRAGGAAVVVDSGGELPELGGGRLAYRHLDVSGEFPEGEDAPTIVRDVVSGAELARTPGPLHRWALAADGTLFGLPYRVPSCQAGCETDVVRYGAAPEVLSPGPKVDRDDEPQHVLALGDGLVGYATPAGMLERDLDSGATRELATDQPGRASRQLLGFHGRTAFVLAAPCRGVPLAADRLAPVLTLVSEAFEDPVAAQRTHCRRPVFRLTARTLRVRHGRIVIPGRCDIACDVSFDLVAGGHIVGGADAHSGAGGVVRVKMRPRRLQRGVTRVRVVSLFVDAREDVITAARQAPQPRLSFRLRRN